MEPLEQLEQGGGNTNSPPSVSGKHRKYCFTLNNYTDDEWNNLITIFHNDLYCFGKEIAPSTGTPHIQGYLEFKSPRSFNRIKSLIPRAHILACRGTRKDNFIYCCKGGNYISNITDIKIPKPVKDPLEGKVPHAWQQEILDIVAEEPDDRTIHWYWETTGCVGKTSLCKHICLTKSCLIVNGKQNDMFNAILQYKTSTEDFPEIILVDIPRSSIDYISWSAIEKIKDGLFYSGKYEGGMVVMNPPHVICFANTAPDESRLSADRWQIANVGDT